MKINPQKIHTHISYTTKELVELFGINAKTCFRWIEAGLKTVEGGKKPILMKGGDIKEFLKNRRIKKEIKLSRYQFLCMSCKVARSAKRGSIKIVGNRKTALCRVCNGRMSKTIKLSQNDYMIHSPPT